MFIDRRDAGEKLASELSRYKDKNVLVLGIPRGGMEVAFYVATGLNADLSMIISRKLGFPLNPEAAFGAIAEDGSIYLTEYAENELDEESIKSIVEKEKEELSKRIKILRKGKPLPDLNNRTVIIVDDGIATGATLFSAIMLCNHQGASELIVAAPVADKLMKEQLANYADDVIILETPRFYHAVSQVYEDFKSLTDDDVLEIMKNWKESRHVNQEHNTQNQT